MASGSGEFEFIRNQLLPLTCDHPGALALKDDAALITPAEGMELVLASDMLIDGVHFLTSDTPQVKARRAFGANLSDMAAMGAEPLGYLLSVAWPRDWSQETRSGFVAGLAAAQADTGAALLGGDTTAHDGPLVVSLTMMGQVPAGSALQRSGARIGDDLWVSGTIGDAMLGLELARRGERTGPLLQRYQDPPDRTGLGVALRGHVTSCIDISDGLVADLSHIAAASGKGIRLEIGDVPVSPAAKAMIGESASLSVLDLVTGGDDYELAFTAPAGARDAIQAIDEGAATALTRVGTVIEGDGVEVVGADGEAVRINRPGFTHF